MLRSGVKAAVDIKLGRQVQGTQQDDVMDDEMMDGKTDGACS